MKKRYNNEIYIKFIKYSFIFLICFLSLTILNYKTAYAQKRNINDIVCYGNNFNLINDINNSQIVLSSINMNPNTGDNENIQKYIDIICIAGIGLIILLSFNIIYSLIKNSKAKKNKNKQIKRKNKTDNNYDDEDDDISKEIKNDIKDKLENIDVLEENNENTLSDIEIKNIYSQIKDSITL